jgi:hypothetical protein
MKSIIFVFIWALIQKLCVGADAIQYDLASNQPLVLKEANLRLMAFHLLPNWVDVTLEYTRNGSAQSAQWFAIGFGNTEIECAYTLTFEPKLDSTNTITDLIITERRFGDQELGIELPRRLSYIETSIRESSTVTILVRFIRQRVAPIDLTVINNSSIQSCPNNPYGYHQFPFNGSNINIIYAKGVNGAHNVSYPTSINQGTSFIPLRPVYTVTLNNTGLYNATNMSTLMSVTCPHRFALGNYTFAQRFDWPYVPRVCGSCQNNATGYNVTMMPLTTQIQSGTNSFSSNGVLNGTAEEYECMAMSDGDYPNPPVCGCTSVNWNDTSIVFLIDGAGYQTDTEWHNFTWRILNGFMSDVMLSANKSMMNTNITMDVNVIIYGGFNRPLQVQKLDWNFLNSTMNDPVPGMERFKANLCNATNFAANYLMRSNGTSKILVTIPWQSPSDELECLICSNCSLAGIQSFTAKIFSEVDLSVLEMTFGAYSDCTYLYNHPAERQIHQDQEWPYVLAAISDFICYATENPITGRGNFTVQLLMTSTMNAQGIYNFSNNITHLLEGAFEIFSNFSLQADRDFDVEILAINNSNLLPPTKPTNGGKQMYTDLINSVIICKDSSKKKLLESISKKPQFSQFLNNSFHRYFEGAAATTFVYSVNNVVLNNGGTVFTTTMFPTLNMSSTQYIKPHHATSIMHRIRNFFRHLVAWKIAAIVVGSVLVCLCLACMCGLCARCCRKDRENYTYASTRQEENAPEVVTNVQAYYTDTQTSNGHYAGQYRGNQYNKPASVDDDQIYV